MKTHSFLSIVSCLMFVIMGSIAHADDGKALAQTCVACHGANGVSPSAIWPNLAGQKRDYLIKEITAFRDGDRNEPTMQLFVKNLSDSQITALANYYSTMATPGNPAAEDINQAGLNVRANCMSCHGVEGNTVNDLWPNLAGQQAQYLLKQLQAFKQGTRHSPIMNVIANELNEQQMKDVAEYYSQLAY
ncbi:MAG: cytochrome c [Pseudomonadales bacterium]